jgi:flavin reductase (DIM6/NTAB) family NADH-FMN oxidoreductase RutF
MGEDALTLRGLMRSVPSSVVVVTALDTEGARGITIGSFVSVSLDPPLVCFNVNHASRMHPILLASRRFAVSFLSDRQARVAARFALAGLSGTEQFEGLSIRLDLAGVPVIEEAVGWMSCQVTQVIEGGDHSIFLGQVETLQAGEDLPPLVYYRGGYQGIGPPVRGDGDR